MPRAGRKPKKTPMRMCVACQNMRAKQDLIRVVAGAAGDVTYDPTGRAPGRGAYLCRDRDCLAKAIKEKRLDRALKAPVPAAAVTRLQEMLAGEKNDTGS